MGTAAAFTFREKRIHRYADSSDVAADRIYEYIIYIAGLNNVSPDLVVLLRLTVRQADRSYLR